VADPVSFFFDQHMPSAAADGLRRHGADVLTAHEAGRCGLPDEKQIRFATAADRVVVTHDEDYLVWAADFLGRGEAFAGIVYCDLDKYLKRPGRLTRDLVTLYGVFTTDDMRDHVEYL